MKGARKRVQAEVSVPTFEEMPLPRMLEGNRTPGPTRPTTRAEDPAPDPATPPISEVPITRRSSTREPEGGPEGDSNGDQDVSNPEAGERPVKTEPERPSSPSGRPRRPTRPPKYLQDFHLYGMQACEQVEEKEPWEFAHRVPQQPHATLAGLRGCRRESRKLTNQEPQEVMSAKGELLGEKVSNVLPVVKVISCVLLVLELRS